MDYGMLGPVESSRSEPDINQARTTADDRVKRRRRRRFFLLALAALLFLSASATLAGVLVRSRGHGRNGSQLNSGPTQAISQTCGLTRYPALCVSSLANFPGALDAGERELVHISLNMTRQRVSASLYGASSIAGVTMDRLARSAYDDCVELLDDSVDQLSRSLEAVSPKAADGADDEDVLTWLSAALTNQDTCAEGLDGVADGYVRRQMTNYLKDLEELVSNSLAIFAASRRSQDFSGIPIENRRRRRRSLLSSGNVDDGFPDWVNPTDRKLLQTPAKSIQADYVVAKDGSGTHKTIADAVKAAPEGSSRRIIIYVKAGRYDENIKVARKKTNIMFVGDGMGKTVVAGSRSVYDKLTTFHTATFAATGAGFIMKEMTIENSAGPEKHQAVALRIGADRAVVYHCSIIGYQDTLYVHSLRQFYRECDVYGTVDFIFGNAAVVIQNAIFGRGGRWRTRRTPLRRRTARIPTRTRGFLSTIAGFKLQATSRQWRVASRRF
ncbi:hypothetical protein HPP92_002919 [Vanilla planifolia]|uniref:Pectinesterase n=1 Tax=Vanilla planifolia TaxID=51239 RepID=A0A835S6E8_VANPL|nr:hypothetical protein HPP92_002919 [Vanilla planifolia]